MAKKKRKLKKKVIPLLLLILISLIVLIIKFAKFNIKNIYVEGNFIYSDQQIIDIAQLQEYPNTFENMSFMIKNRLEKDLFINKAKVKKQGLFKVIIEVEENYPLFYYQVEDKVILLNGKKTNKKTSNITVVNQIPDTVYTKFYNKMKNIDINVLSKISEIKYSPNDVDPERFFIIMNDGNYVYITIDRFKLLNKYLDILSKFGNKHGILHLDAGEYFEVFK